MSATKRSCPYSSDEAVASSSSANVDGVSTSSSSATTITASSSSTIAPPCKKALSSHEIIKFTSIRSLNELDKHTLQLQNKKLYDNLIDKRYEINSLKERIEQLELRQSKDDELLCVVNRYWNQLDEDCALLLKKMEHDIDDDDACVSSSAESFLKQLSSWDTEEVEHKFKDRVHFSMRIISKIITHCDRNHNRLERLRSTVKGYVSSNGAEASAELESLLHDEVNLLNDENHRLQNLTIELQQKLHETSLKIGALHDQVQLSSEKADEWEAKYNELEYKWSDTLTKLHRIDRRLAESQAHCKSLEEEITTLKGDTASPDVGGYNAGGGVAKSKFNELQAELEEVKEISQSRLNELERMQKNLEEQTEQCESLKAELREIPEKTVVESVPYKSLKEQFNILHNEVVHMRTILVESRQSSIAIRLAHQSQINEMRNNEAIIQNQMRNEMTHLQEQYSILRRDFEAMELDLRQTQAQNEQAQPIHSEMRDLISHLQAQHKQSKSESARYKKAARDVEMELKKLTEDKKLLEEQLDAKEAELEKHRHGPAHTIVKNSPCTSDSKTSAIALKGKSDAEIIDNLTAELQRSQDAQREMKVLLDMYKIIPREQRDRVALMKSEQNLLKEVEQLKTELKSLKEPVDPQRTLQASSLTPAHFYRLQDELKATQLKLANAKQESEAVLKELEMTGQAFEDVQEQNIRLLQTLREKEDANLKLVSEHVKISQFHGYAKEEKMVLEEQNKMLSAQIEALHKALGKQEEKERLLLNNIATLDKEAVFRNQATEQYRRKMMESQQVTEDLRMSLQKYLSQLRETQTAVQEKASALKREAFKYKRTMEDFSVLRKKYERSKKIEQSHNADEVLLAEIQEYKDQLTCPTCKTNRKDAILTKCFHVFCLSCLKKRYEMRNRKCPKCNATFGANDYHRIYFS